MLYLCEESSWDVSCPKPQQSSYTLHKICISQDSPLQILPNEPQTLWWDMNPWSRTSVRASAPHSSLNGSRGQVGRQPKRQETILHAFCQYPFELRTWVWLTDFWLAWRLGCLLSHLCWFMSKKVQEERVLNPPLHSWFAQKQDEYRERWPPWPHCWCFWPQGQNMPCKFGNLQLPSLNSCRPRSTGNHRLSR